MRRNRPSQGSILEECPGEVEIIFHAARRHLEVGLHIGTQGSEFGLRTSIDTESKARALVPGGLPVMNLVEEEAIAVCVAVEKIVDRVFFVDRCYAVRCVALVDLCVTGADVVAR